MSVSPTQGGFVVNPPIQSDSQYYRYDEAIVERALNGESLLAVGLRRSGKTSFLLRVAREATTRGRAAVVWDLGEINGNRLETQRAFSVRLQEVFSKPDAIVLLDEAETLLTWSDPEIGRLANACRGRTVVVACAPALLLDPRGQTGMLGRWIESLTRHFLAGLSEAEAADLLNQRKSGSQGPLSAEAVRKILQGGERLPLILQALGEEASGGPDRAILLAGLGARVLSGLTDDAAKLLVGAAATDAGEPLQETVRILVALGALRIWRGRVEFASKVLGALLGVREHPVQSSRPEGPRTTTAPREWRQCATILHLSDLHFGPHCIEQRGAPEIQAGRLVESLDKDKIVPDFIAVTGDLSWSGSAAELDLAARFLEKLAAWLRSRTRLSDKESRRRVLMVPGNHEAAWVLSKGACAGEKEGRLSREDATRWIAYSTSPFANAANHFYRGALIWDVEAPCHVVTFSEPPVTFFLLSTCHGMTEEERNGRFGERGRESVKGHLATERVAQSRFRVGLCHHNLRTFGDEGRVVVDVEAAVADFVRTPPGLDLMLHGHVHQGEVDKMHPRGGFAPLSYVAVGSFGVRAAQRPGDDSHGRVPNEFAVVRLEVQEIQRRLWADFYRLELTPATDWVWSKQKTAPPQLV